MGVPGEYLLLLANRFIVDLGKQGFARHFGRISSETWFLKIDPTGIHYSRAPKRVADPCTPPNRSRAGRAIQAGTGTQAVSRPVPSSVNPTQSSSVLHCCSLSLAFAEARKHTYILTK